MHEALALLQQNPNTTVRQVAEQFGIPKSTLSDRQRNSHSELLGRPNSLPMEVERELAKTVVRFCEKGCAMFVSELKDIALAYAKTQLSERCKFKASTTWVERFIKSWELQEWETSSARVLGFHRRIAATENVINSWIQKLFEGFNSYLDDLGDALDVNICDLTHEQISSGFLEWMRHQ